MKRPLRRGLARVYLAYVDDSGVTDDRCQFAVFAAVLIHDTEWSGHEGLAGKAIVELVGEDNFDGFIEFHARSLYKGVAPFEKIPEADRHSAIKDLLGIVEFEPQFEAYTAVVYGAVDKYALKNTLIASVDPADVAFRTCILGIEQYLESKEAAEISRDFYGPDDALLIMDDTGDSKLKDRLRKTFRQLRGRRTRYDSEFNMIHPGQLKHFHDDLYFGNSSESIGLQLADMCAYFIGLHLRGDSEAEPFYNIFEKYIRFSNMFPEESRRQ